MLITGGGSGVGLACAELFAARGARLVLCDSDGPALMRAGDELGAVTCYCDVTSEASVAIFAEDVLNRFPGVDVLINAAGEGYVRTLGMMRITLVFLPSMRREGTPKLIFNIAPNFEPAGLGEALFPNVASRRNFRRLSASLAIQARGSSVRVATIMSRRAIGDDTDESTGTRCDPTDVVEAVVSAVFGATEAAEREAGPNRFKRTG